MVRTQIYLPEDQIARLKQLAYQEDISLSEVIRRAIKEKITLKNKKSQVRKERKYKSAGEWLLSMAKEAERKGFKGPKDLASHVDKYLYGKK